jgi:hypothetical protein
MEKSLKGKVALGISLFLLSFTLMGCSASNENSAQGEVILGCSEFTSNYLSDGYQTSEAARRHFARAARLDPGFIPLAQAAMYTSEDFSTALSSNYVTQWRDAVNLILGVCEGA